MDETAGSRVTIRSRRVSRKGTDGNDRTKSVEGRRTGAGLSPTLATTFLGCRQAAAWEMVRSGHVARSEAGGHGADVKPAAMDAMGKLVTRRGNAHETAVLDALRAAHGDDVAVVFEGSPDPKRQTEDIAATREAMEAGAAFVHQAALEWSLEMPDGTRARWFGYADFLRRVDRPSESWAWSYEPWDAKLTTRPKPSHLLQLCVYADMVAAVQGTAPLRIGLMLGAGAPDDEFDPPEHDEGAHLAIGDKARHVSFPLEHFRYYARRVARRVVEFRAGMPHDGLEPAPCAHCAQCHWSERCDALWDETDHLCRVADIRATQIRRLKGAGIGTRRELAFAVLPDAVSERPDATMWGISNATLERLAQQARLQEETREGAGTDERPAPATELLPARPGRGLARLPEPDVADVWFDFEGDPLEPGGLDYLNGVLVRAEAVSNAAAEGFEPVVLDGKATPYLFRAFWAHDREEEGRTFAVFMDWQAGHFARHPDAHLYHYAPYEKTALRRMASLHATHEGELDAMLREGRLIDLYRVVREAVRVGADSYSIKSLEPLYMPVRDADTKGGGDSIAVYHAWRDTREQGLLDDIEHYNREDCVSTVLLHEWLLDRAREAGVKLGTGEEAAEAQEAQRRERRAGGRSEAQRANDEKQAAKRRAIREEAHALHAELTSAEGNETRVRMLCRDLAQFHGREDKPVWWEFFDRLDTETEGLVENMDCLGGLTADPSCWGERDKKSERFRYRVPEQHTKFSADTISPTMAAVPEEFAEWLGEGAGTIEDYDEVAGTLTLRRQYRKDGSHVPPKTLSLIPGGPLDKADVVARTTEVVRDVAGTGDAFPHIARFLFREPPKIAGHPEGAPIVPAGVRDPNAVLDATVRAAVNLDHSWLAIQGPPGTGKTYTLARVIEALVASGKRVGVTANSHKVIDNVLEKVEGHWTELKLSPGQRKGLKKKDSRSDKGYEGPRTHVDEVNNADELDAHVVGGTAWAFSNEHFTDPDNKLDVLVVDEAGQVSLGMLLASASAARNIVLVGDPMQLPQPLKGTHPGESGLSCLEYVLEQNPVLPPDRGVFLPTTWRMHPDVCGWVSDAVYAGQLAAEERCARQRLVPCEGADPAVRPTGLSFVEVEHAGCTQSSEAEAARVVALVRDLMASEVVDREGDRRSMSPFKTARKSVLVVSPYNVQVRLLRRRLDEAGFDDVPVGTVDKFQGQEAEAVIVSMATSDAEHMPRDASFLLSQNRLNVAVSRARCLAVIVASPGLLDLNARNVKEMQLANLLCWAAEAGPVRA